MKTTKWTFALAVMALTMTGCGGKNKAEVENVVVVKTVTASPSVVTDGQGYAGTIEAQSGSSLSFAGAGTIKSLSVHEGQNVAAGQLIGVIDASTSGNAVTMAKAATQQAQEALTQAEDAYRRMKMLHDNGSLPEMKWVEVETKVAQARQMLTQAQAAEKIARKGLADTRLTAPFGGYVARKNGEVGQNVLPGQPIVELVKIDQVKVKLSVPEDEISRLKIGQRVMFQVASLGETAFSGTISEKSVSADPISRAYTVKADVPNADHKLLPGMVCDAYISDAGDSSEKDILLPANIIQIDIDNQPFVWIVEGDKARKRPVVLGENIGERVVIKGGLMQGTKVIVEGQQKVSNGQKIQVR